LVRDAAALRRQAAESERLSTPVSVPTGPGLHEALEAYARYARAKTTKEWGVREGEAAVRLKRSHPDVPLAAFGMSQIEKMAAYWRARPNARKTDRPIALGTVTNHLKTAKRFIGWLDRSGEYEWSKPAGAGHALRA